MVAGNVEKGSNHLFDVVIDPLAVRTRCRGEEGGAEVLRGGLADNGFACQNNIRSRKRCYCCGQVVTVWW